MAKRFRGLSSEIDFNHAFVVLHHVHRAFREHSVVVVEHDMEFIESIANVVTVLHEGSVLAEGTMDMVQNDERVIEVYLGR